MKNKITLSRGYMINLLSKQLISTKKGTTKPNDLPKIVLNLFIYLFFKSPLHNTINTHQIQLLMHHNHQVNFQYLFLPVHLPINHN